MEVIRYIIFSIVLYLMFFYRRRSMYDRRTGLLLNEEFERRLVKKMRWIIKHPEYQIYYYFIDLDNFGILNKTLGHKQGDQILKKVSKLLKKNVRGKFRFNNWRICPPDIVGRYGGDEFCIACLVLKSKVTKKTHLQIGKRINEVISCNSKCTISIGVSIFTHLDAIHIEKLVNQANKAMFKVKKNGKNNLIGSK